jgi:baculoviral IAP repeat-containing protein 6
VSNAVQVLVSIQSLIMTPLPYYNEPGFEAQRGTPRGEQHAAAYDAVIREATLRYAILEPLRCPPVGFEAAAAAYFRQRREPLRAQMGAWTALAPEGEARARVQDLVTRIEALLAQL